MRIKFIRQTGKLGACLLGMIATGMFMASHSHANVLVAEGPNNISVQTIARNAVHDPMLQISIENPAGQPNAEITAVTVSASSNGSGNDILDIAPGGVELYWDKDNDGHLTTSGDPVDVLLGSGNFDGDNGTITFSGFVVPVAQSVEVNLIVLYTLAPSATTGKSFRARVLNNSAISVRDAATLNPVGVSGAPVNGFIRTVGAGTLTIIRIEQVPDGAVAIPNRQLLPLFNLQFFANDVEDLRITSLDFLDIETANMVTGIVPGSVRLFVGSAAPVNPLDAKASGSFAGDNGRVTLVPGTPIDIPRAKNIFLWVTVDCVSEAGGVIGSEYQIQVPTLTPMIALGKTSADPAAIIGTGVNGPSWQFNYNPLIFSKGDDLGAVFMPPTGLNYPLLAFQIQNDPDAKSEAAVISQFTFHVDGTVNDQTAFSALRLYQDNAPRGVISGTDVQLGGDVAFLSDNGAVTINFIGNSLALTINGRRNFIVGCDLTGTAVNGQTARLSLQTRNDMVIIGGISTVNGSLVPSPFLGNIKTIGQPRAEFRSVVDEDVTPSIVAPGAIGFHLFSFSIKDLNDEEVDLKGIRLRFKGPLNEMNYFTSLSLWFDSNGDGEKQVQDFQIGPAAVLAADNGDALVEIQVPDEAAYRIPTNTTRKFTVYADVNPGVIGDGTEAFTIQTMEEADIFLYGASSGVHARFTTVEPPSSTARTIRNPRADIARYAGLPASFFTCINGTYGITGLVFNTPSGEDLLIEKVRFSVTGSLNDPMFLAAAFVWNDKNRNYYINNGEGFLGYADFPVALDNGSGVIDLTVLPNVNGRALRNEEYELTLGVAFQALDAAVAQAQRGKTITAFQVSNLVIEGKGELSGRPIEVSNPAGDDEGRTFTMEKGNLEVSLDAMTRTLAPPNAKNVEVLALYTKTDEIEDVRIDKLTLTPKGTINESIHIQPETDAIKIWLDMNHNGKWDEGTDILWATGPRPAVNNGPITFTEANAVGSVGNTVYTYPPLINPYDQLLVTVDVSASAPEGATIQFALQSTSDLEATGACSLFPYVSQGDVTYPSGLPPLNGPVITIQRGAIDLQTDPSFADDPDNVPEVVMAPLAVNYEVARLDVKAAQVESIRVNSITLRSTGTALEDADLKSAGVLLYRGVVTNANNLLTSGTFNMDDGSVTLSNFTKDLVLYTTTTTPVDLRLAFSGTGSGVLGNDFNLTISAADLDAVGIDSELPITDLIPADPYVAIPIRFGKGKLTVRADDDDDFILPIPLGQDAKIQYLRFTASRTEGIRVEDITTRAKGTANEITAFDSGAIHVNSRSGNNPPVLIGSAPLLPGDDGEAALRNLNMDIEADGNSGNLYSLDAALNPLGTVIGTTLRLDIESIAGVRAVGALTGEDLPIVLEDFAGPGAGILNAANITGRTLTFSTGVVTLSKGSQNPDNAAILGTEQLLPLMQIRVQVDENLEAVTLTEIRICANGTVNEATAIGNVYLYLDVDQDGLATDADVLLDTTTYDGDNGTARFDNLLLTYPVDADLRWVIAADLTAAGVTGQTIQATLCTPPTITGTGQLTDGPPINLIVSSTAPIGALYTLPTPLGTPTPSPIPTIPPTATPSPTPTPTPFYDAQVVSHTVPGQIPADHGVPVEITMRNTGNTTWTSAAGYSLAVITDGCTLVSGTRIGMDMAAAIQPNEQYTFTTIMTGPANTGPCSIEFRMVLEFVTFFGQTLSLNPEIVDAVNNATPLSHTVPLIMAPGQSLGVGLTFRNQGNTTWLHGEYSLGVKSDGCGLFDSPQLEVFEGDPVSPTKQIQFLGQITAPMTIGPCNVTVQMKEGASDYFGAELNLSLNVVAPANAAKDWALYE